MTDEWVRLDAPPPMPEEGEEVEVRLWQYSSDRAIVTRIAEYLGDRKFMVGNIIYRAQIDGGSVIAWRRKK